MWSHFIFDICPDSESVNKNTIRLAIPRSSSGAIFIESKRRRMAESNSVFIYGLEVWTNNEFPIRPLCKSSEENRNTSEYERY